jgi:hypothetical protein
LRCLENNSIFALSNHVNVPGDTVAAEWIPRMRGNYVQIKLITDNLEGPMYLHSAKTEVSENIR